MPADLEVDSPPDQQKLPIDCVLRTRMEGFGAGEHEQTGGHDRPLPEAAELLQRMQRQHVEALCFGRRHCGGNQLRSGAHIGIDKAEPVTLRQQCAAPACMRLADPALRQHPRRSQPHSGICGAALLDRSRRTVLRVVIDNNDRPAAGKSGLRPQPVETPLDILYFVSGRHDDRDRRQNRELARHGESELPIGRELAEDAPQQKEHQRRPGRAATKNGHQASRRCAASMPI